jgi:hypothetical protein
MRSRRSKREREEREEQEKQEEQEEPDATISYDVAMGSYEVGTLRGTPISGDVITVLRVLRYSTVIRPRIINKLGG